MEQNTVVRNLAGSLKANRWNPSLEVIYDLGNNGRRGENEHGAFYLWDKVRRTGRRDQTARVDILARRDDIRTVELSVEVAFCMDRYGRYVAPRPKDVTGLLLAPAAAFCHARSNEYRKPYALRDTVIAVVTSYPTPEALQDDRAYARELFTRFHVAERGVRELCVCGGATEAEVEASFQEMVRTRFLERVIFVGAQG
jgi:hypothetical protein